MGEPPSSQTGNTNPSTSGSWRRRLVWAAWAALEVFLLQNAWASRREHEPRAALLFAVLFVVLLLGAGIVRFIRRAGLLE